MIPNFHALVDQVYADWNYGHPKILYGLLRSLQPATAVEVGSYRGLSASWMARALQENGTGGHLWCIENFSLRDHEARLGDPRTHLERNWQTLGVRDTITLLVGDSDKVEWPQPLGFAYIDGWHGFLGVKHDFEKAASLGAECICFDDTTQSVGPRMLMQKIRLTDQWDVLDVRRDCGLTICMRKQPKGPITFSQELPGDPGVDLRALSGREQAEHFARATAANNVDYAPIIGALTEPKA